MIIVEQLGEMFAQHLGCDVVFASVLGVSTSRYHPWNIDFDVGFIGDRGDHHVHVSHLYQR